MVAIMNIPPAEDKNDLKGTLARYVKSKEQVRAERVSHDGR
jgi:hypothetical protein